MKQYLARILLSGLALGAVSGVLAPVGGAHSSLSPATFGAITEFAVPSPGSSPSDICTGPDGTLWFTEATGDKIGRVSRLGAITEFPTLSLSSRPTGITAGSDGNLWFTERATDKIGRISPVGQITEFHLPLVNSAPEYITDGADSSLWFTEDSGRIGRITPAGGFTEYTVTAAASGLLGITRGSDGNIWFTEKGDNQVGRITPNGSFVRYTPLTGDSQPIGIVSGPDGNLWFTESHANQIGRITPLGVITEFPMPAGVTISNPQNITLGADGNLWFSGYSSNNLARITPAGTVTAFTVPSANSVPAGITAGPDQNIWFTEFSAGKIVRFELGLATPTATGTATNTVVPNGGTVTRTPIPPSSTATRTVPPFGTATGTLPPAGTATRTALPATASPTPQPSATLPPATATATALPSNVWIARAAYPIPIKDGAVVAQAGFIYGFGGHTTSGTTAAAYRYDPNSDSWVSLPPLPDPLEGLSAVSDGTFIYLLNGGHFSNSLYRYDPAAGTYSVLAAAPTGTYLQSAVYLNGIVYRIGGEPDAAHTGTNSVDAYSIATNTWAPVTPYPQSAHLLMVTAANGLLYVAGGTGDLDLKRAYRYDRNIAAWDDAAVPDLPLSRWGAASGLLGGKWVLAGGNEEGTTTSSALIWDLLPGHGWQSLPPMLQARQNVGGAAIGFNFFAVGGANSAGTPTTDVQEYLAPCDLSFSDVQPADYFYTPVQYLACHGVISGYNDGTFRPYNQTTRAQLAKIIVGGEGWSVNTTGGPHFNDVGVGSTFYPFVETAFNHGIISGYNDGSFRPSNPVTRGQLSKIIVGAQGWAVNTTGAPHFVDLGPDSIFYPAIETAFNHGIISGYSDSTFRPGNPATRGQIAKIVYLALQSSLAGMR